jgi:putative aldouronate transport system substrate-binding protein
MNKLIYLVFILTLIFSCRLNTKDDKTNDEETILLSFYTYKNRKLYYPHDGGPARLQIKKMLNEQGLDIDYNNRYFSTDDYWLILEQDLISRTGPMGFSLFRNQLKDFVDLDLILPLNDYFDDLAPYLKWAKPEDLLAFTYEGKLYGLPRICRPESINGPLTGGWFIRDDWLETLGLDYPTTLEELEEVLRLFTEADPDKNGLNDTYGMEVSSDFSMIWGAFGLPYVNEEKAWLFQGGEFSHISVEPDAIEVLKLLRKWYRLGYISPNSFNISSDDISINEKVGIGSGDIWKFNPFLDHISFIDEYIKFSLLPPVMGPEGVGAYPVLNEVDRALALSSQMSEKEIHAMIDFLLWTIDDSEKGGFMTVNYGIEGENYSYDPEENRIIQLKSRLRDTISEGYSLPIRFIPIIDRRWVQNDKILNEIATLNVPQNHISPDVLPSTYRMTLEGHLIIEDLWKRTYVGIIMGALPLSAWDDYIKIYNSTIFFYEK